jgi:hypothetical protein
VSDEQEKVESSVPAAQGRGYAQTHDSRSDTFEQADFVIVTVLGGAQAVVRRLENCHIERFEAQDIRTYHCGLVRIREGDRAYRVVVISLPSMGEIAAANAVTDAVTRWRPRFVLMVGIAGGIPVLATCIIHSSKS